MSSLFALTLALVAATQSGAAAADPASDDPAARERYDALLAAHRAAPAIHVVGSAERTLVPRTPLGAPTETLLIEGEANCARPRLGWVRTTSVRRLGPELEAGKEEPDVVSVEFLADGKELFEVDSKARRVVPLGADWFVVFPQLSPMQEWVGAGAGRPARVAFEADASGLGRTGLRLEWRSLLRPNAPSTELLWLDTNGRIVAAETVREDSQGRVETRYTLRAWELRPTIETERYHRNLPVGFESVDPLADVEAELLPPGSIAPDVELLAVDGTTQSLNALRGSVLVLVFWAESSAASVAALDLVQSLWNEIASERDDVAVRAINLGATSERVSAYWQEKGYTFPAAVQRENELSKAFGVQLYPSVYLLGKERQVLWRGSDLDPVLLRALLAATR